MTDYPLNIQQGALPNPPVAFPLTVKANDTLRFNYNFDYYRIVTMNDSEKDSILIRFGDSANESKCVGAGLGFQLPYVTDRIYFRNTSGADITFTVILAIGKVDDNRVVFATGTSIPTSVVSGSVLDSQPDVSCAAGATTLVLAANTNRKRAVIGNLPTNSATLRVGDSGAGASNGQFMIPGAVYTPDTAAAIYVYNPAGSAQSVTVTEITA